MVIDVSKRFFPQVSSGFNDPRVQVHVRDGFEFMRQHENEFDVIITDSSDPIGPAATLFQKSYYELLNGALRAGGIVCSQGESYWLHLDLICNLLKQIKSVFPTVDYATISQPTYPTGQIGFIVASKDSRSNFRKPVRGSQVPDGLRFYSAEMHAASFVLPAYAARRVLDSLL